jgi:hypothetical protein
MHRGQFLYFGLSRNEKHALRGSDNAYSVHITLNNMNVLAQRSQVVLYVGRHKVPSAQNVLNLSGNKKRSEPLG